MTEENVIAESQLLAARSKKLLGDKRHMALLKEMREQYFTFAERVYAVRLWTSGMDPEDAMIETQRHRERTIEEAVDASLYAFTGDPAHLEKLKRRGGTKI